jgi:hypothetical protein
MEEFVESGIGKRYNWCIGNIILRLAITPEEEEDR